MCSGEIVSINHGLKKYMDCSKRVEQRGINISSSEKYNNKKNLERKTKYRIDGKT